MNKFSSFKEYISEVDFDLFLEMAMGTREKASGGRSHLFDDDNQHYLHQFHPSDHAHAMEHLLGKGLHDAATDRHAAKVAYLEEKYPDLSWDERWEKWHEDPHNPMDAVGGTVERHKNKGIDITREGSTYYKNEKLGEWVAKHKEQHDFDDKTIEMMKNGFFKSAQLTILAKAIDGKEKWPKKPSLKAALEIFKKEKIEFKKMAGKKIRRYHVDSHARRMMEKLEGPGGSLFDKEELGNDSHDVLHDHGHRANTTNVDLSFPNTPDHENLDDATKAAIAKGERGQALEFSTAQAISRNAAGQALKNQRIATALGVFGDVKETHTDRHGKTHETTPRAVRNEQHTKKVLHGEGTEFVIEAETNVWESKEERMQAFRMLKGALEDKWIVDDESFVNGDSGSSITISGPSSGKAITSWINGVSQGKGHSGKPPVPDMCVAQKPGEKKCRKMKFKVTSSEGKGTLNIPHFENEVKYTELETIGDHVVSSEKKTERVWQPIANKGRYILPFEECLESDRLRELGIHIPNPKKPEEASIRTAPPRVLAKGGADFILHHWNKLNDDEKKCMTTYLNSHCNIMDSMRKKEWEKVTGTPYRKCKVLTTLGGVAPGNKDTQAHYPLHRYTIDKKGKGFMNKEYHALFAVAVGDIHGDAPETETVAEQVNEGEDAEQVYFRVKAKHDGPAWQAAVDGLYNKIRLATWLSEPAKQVLGRSLDDLVPFAVRRIVENLGHHAIGRGFERIVDENGKVKFTYDAEKDVGGVGEKEMRKQATDWLKSYVQQEYQVGIGKRRGRTGAQSLERGGSTGEGDEGAVDVSTEQGRQFTGIGQDSAGKYYATPRDEDKSHFVQHGYSDRDFIRRNSQKGSDLSGLKKKISNRMNAFMSRLAQDQANWLNNNPGKTEIPGKVMDLLIASMVNDKKFMADNDMGHLSSAEALKALDSKELKDKLEKSTAEKDQRDYASLELDNQTQLYFDLFKDLAEKGTATWRGQELSLNTVRDEGLLEQFKELYENTKKRIEDSSIGEKEQYLKSLKDYWDKIIGADPMEVDPMEADSMEKLEGLLETLKKKVGLSPVQRKILMNNLDSKKKKYGGIQGYLKSFDKAAENKATLKHLLVLIRNKLNELQKVA